MTTPRKDSPWPKAGLGLVGGAAVAVPAAALLDWPMALAIAVGAALGLVGGAIAAQGSRDSRS